jgi:phosphotransferase system HPr (HPr) family protein
VIVEREVKAEGAAGLHARPAAAFAARAATFRSTITVHKGQMVADATSPLLLLTLDVRQGDRVVVRADGPDAHAAVETLARLVASP